MSKAAVKKATLPSASILLVDDDPQVRSVLSELLGRLGYDVLRASTGEIALRILEESGVAVDLVITDVVMPGMGGGTLSQKVNSLSPKTKILYISGYHSEALKRHKVLDPDVAVLAKPFTRELLARRVEQALKRPGAPCSQEASPA